MAGNGDQLGSSLGLGQWKRVWWSVTFGCGNRTESFFASGGRGGAAAGPVEDAVLSFTGSLKVFVALQPCDLAPFMRNAKPALCCRLGESLNRSLTSS